MGREGGEEEKKRGEEGREGGREGGGEEHKEVEERVERCEDVNEVEARKGTASSVASLLPQGGTQVGRGRGGEEGAGEGEERGEVLGSESVGREGGRGGEQGEQVRLLGLICPTPDAARQVGAVVRRRRNSAPDGELLVAPPSSQTSFTSPSSRARMLEIVSLQPSQRWPPAWARHDWLRGMQHL